MEITAQSVLLGALGIIATTALGIAVTRLVNRLLDWRSQLIVEVRVNERLKSPKLVDDLKRAMKRNRKWEEQQDLPFSLFDKYSQFFDSEKYIKLTITNQTPKKITGLTVSLNISADLLQIGPDGDIVELPHRAPPTALGDLQPRRNIDVHVLASGLFSTATNQAIKQSIVFSSDEHVHVRYKFPPPDHIAFAQKQRRNAVLSILILILSLCSSAFISTLTGK